MPNRNGKSRTKPARRGRKPSEPGPSTVSYKGPIGAPRNDQYVTMCLTVTPLQITTDASGASNGFVSTSAVTSTTDWGTLSPQWGEVRLLGMRVDFRPAVPDSSQQQPVGFLAEVHSNSWSTPSAPSSVANVPGKQFISLGKSWSKTWRMQSIDEAAFSPTNAAYPNFGGVTWASQFGPASTVIGYYVVVMELQFRSQN